MTPLEAIKADLKNGEEIRKVVESKDLGIYFRFRWDRLLNFRFKELERIYCTNERIIAVCKAGQVYPRFAINIDYSNIRNIKKRQNNTAARLLRINCLIFSLIFVLIAFIAFTKIVRVPVLITFVPLSIPFLWLFVSYYRTYLKVRGLGSVKITTKNRIQPASFGRVPRYQDVSRRAITGAIEFIGDTNAMEELFFEANNGMSIQSTGMSPKKDIY